jgi:hypothetical protein
MRENRQATRIIRPLNIKFSLSHENPPKWDMSSVIGDISVGGVKFFDIRAKFINLSEESKRDLSILEGEKR